jgi:hypothetical protein
VVVIVTYLRRETESLSEGITKTRTRTAAVIAWSIWLLVLIFVVTTFFSSHVMSEDWYLVTHPFSASPAVIGKALVFAVLGPALFLAYATVGAVVASLRPENGVGWLCLSVGFFAVLSDFLFWVTERIDLVFFATWHSWLNLVPVMVPLLALTLMLLIFPEGRLPSRRWRLAVLSAVAGTVLVSIADALPTTYPGVAAVGTVGGLTSVAALLASVAAIVVRWRRGPSQERQQLKWLVYTFALTIAAGLCALTSWYVQGDIPGARSYSTVIFSVAVMAGIMVGIPIAIGVAILRHRLYDIDRIINRTLVYGGLTVSLVLLYIGGVATTQTIFRVITSQERQPQLAIVASTLVIAALFNPLRRRIQGFIDRRFYRRKYDATKTLAVFSGRLRDETDLNTLSNNLLAVVRETMQPTYASLWLRPDPELRRREQHAPT